MGSKKISFIIVFFLIILFVSIFGLEHKDSDTGEIHKFKTVVFKILHKDGYISSKEFENMTQGVIFFTDSYWNHARGRIDSYRSPNIETELPSVNISKNGNITLNFLWEVPSFGKTVLRLDLSEFRDGEETELNKELALQNLETLEKRLENSNSDFLIHGIDNYGEKSERYFEKGGYMRSLNNSLWGLEKLTLLEAEQRIKEIRKSAYNFKVTDEYGDPIENVSINYEMITPDFSFGWFGSDINETLISKMQELGFNEAQIFSFWYETEPEDDSWNFGEKKEKLGKLANFTNGISGLIGDTPRYLSNVSDSQLSDEVEEHVENSIREFESIKDINSWECYGLGMHYWADKTLQMTDDRNKSINMASTKKCIETVNQNTNDSVIVTGWNIDGSEIRNSSYTDSPYRYYQRLNNLKFDIGFDFMYFGGAHEMYPDLVKSGVYKKDAVSSARKNWIPARHLYSISEMLDWYSSLNRSVHIQYFQAPSNYVEGQHGFWHQEWNENVQAEWIKKYYKLIYSKPFIESINYLEVRDAEWKDLKTGILYQNSTPKKSYYTLKRLLDGWKSKGEASTDSNGRVSFTGFEGTYRIFLDKNNYETKEVITSKKDNNITLKAERKS